MGGVWAFESICAFSGSRPCGRLCRSLLAYMLTISCAFHSTDSPRVYKSTNPWKISCTFEAVSSTRAEYVALLERLRAATPAVVEDSSKKKKQKDKDGKDKPSPAVARRQDHISLVERLAERLEVVDKEIAVRFSCGIQGRNADDIECRG